MVAAPSAMWPSTGIVFSGRDVHQVVDLDRVQRRLDLRAVHADPDGAGLLTEEVGVVRPGVPLDLVEQVARAQEHEVVEVEQEVVPAHHAEGVDANHERVDRDRAVLHQ